VELTAVFVSVPEGFIGFAEELRGANTQICLLAGFAGAIACWIGLLFHALVPRRYDLFRTVRETNTTRAYEQFVRDTFAAQSAYAMLEGLV
jgi:hypothetical protein